MLTTTFLRSGVTRVGVTRGGNCVTPSCFFLEKKWRPFLLITITFNDFTRVSPPGRCQCHPGRSAPTIPLVTPLFLRVSMTAERTASKGGAQTDNNIHDAIILRQWRGLSRTKVDDSNIVDENIQPPELLNGSINEAGNTLPQNIGLRWPSVQRWHSFGRNHT